MKFARMPRRTMLRTVGVSRLVMFTWISIFAEIVVCGSSDLWIVTNRWLVAFFSRSADLPRRPKFSHMKSHFNAFLLIFFWLASPPFAITISHYPLSLALSCFAIEMKWQNCRYRHLLYSLLKGIAQNDDERRKPLNELTRNSEWNEIKIHQVVLGPLDFYYSLIQWVVSRRIPIRVHHE